MGKEMDNAFQDVRTAFRLIYKYQTRVQSIINYIREHTLFPSIGGASVWGRRLFCDTIHGSKKSPDKDYANLNVHLDMWGWDFLYNYMFEYYFGIKKFGRQEVEMSIIQISDDGFFKSVDSRPSKTKISTFLPSEDSQSNFIFMAGVSKVWMNDSEEKDMDTFLHKFIASNNDVSKYVDEKGNWFIAKKYPMQRFLSQIDADKIIIDYGNLIHDTTGIKIFK